MNGVWAHSMAYSFQQSRVFGFRGNCDLSGHIVCSGQATNKWLKVCFPHSFWIPAQQHSGNGSLSLHVSLTLGMFMCNVTSLCLPASKNSLKSLLRIRSMSCSVWHVRYTLHMISEHNNMQLLLEDPKMDSYYITDTFCSTTSIHIGSLDLLLTIWSPFLF